MNFLQKYNNALVKAIDDRKKVCLLGVEIVNSKTFLSKEELRNLLLKEKEADLLARESEFAALSMGARIQNASNISFDDIKRVIIPFLKDQTGYDYEFKCEYHDIKKWIYLKRTDYDVKGISDIVSADNGEIILLASTIWHSVDSISFYDKGVGLNEISFLENMNYEVLNRPLSILRNFIFSYVDYQIREDLYEKELPISEFCKIYLSDKESTLEEEYFLGYHDIEKREYAQKREDDKIYKKREITLKYKKEAEYRSGN